MKTKTIAVRIDGRTAHLDVNQTRFKKLVPFFRFHPNNYQYRYDYKQFVAKKKELVEEGMSKAEAAEEAAWYGWNGYTNLLSEIGQCPAQLFRVIAPEIEKKTKYRFRIEDEDTKPVFFKHKFAPIVSKREYQNECCQLMMEACHSGGGLILNATGTGKTFIAGMFFSRLEGNGVFIVDELGLLMQARRELSKVMGEKVGMIGKSKFIPRRITVATVQSLHKHRSKSRFRRWKKTIDVVMVDEVHKAMNRRHFSVVEAIQAGATFGLTATLRLRKTGTRLRAFALCGPVVYNYPLVTGVKEGYLTRGKVIQLQYQNDFYPRRGLKGYQKDYTQHIALNKKRNDFIEIRVKTLLAMGKYVVVLVERLKHLRILSKRFKEFPHQLVYGGVRGEQRLAAVGNFDAGQFRLIIANVVFTKGIDIKRVDAMVDCAAKRNPDDAMQKFGRGVRLHKDKTLLLYYDIADVGNRFEKASKERRKAFEQNGIEVKIRGQN